MFAGRIYGVGGAVEGRLEGWEVLNGPEDAILRRTVWVHEQLTEEDSIRLLVAPDATE